MQASKSSGCFGRYCTRWGLSHRQPWSAKCSRCIATWTIDKDGNGCLCCENPKLLVLPLSSMDVRENNQFYSLAPDMGVSKVLEHLRTPKTTRQLLDELNDYRAHSSLKKLEALKMIERKPMLQPCQTVIINKEPIARNYQRVIVNALTLKGKNFAWFASIYNTRSANGWNTYELVSSISNGNGKSLSRMKLSRNEPKEPEPKIPFNNPDPYDREEPR